jgi:hypothetical protein
VLSTIDPLDPLELPGPSVLAPPVVVMPALASPLPPSVGADAVASAFVSA